jgi:hypothetical protein
VSSASNDAPNGAPNDALGNAGNQPQSSPQNEPQSQADALMQRATILHQARKPAEAAALYEQVLALDPGHADALHLLGVARGQAGDNRAALALIDKAIERRGDVAIYHLNKARALSKLGDKGGMVAALHRTIALDGRDDAARMLLTQHLMPGVNYIAILKCLHDWLQPETYLEIGVESGRSLALALPPTRCIGIDPAPQIEVQFSAETKIIKLTSDDFFAEHDPAEEFGRPFIDLAFIDGLHLFEQTLRDFINVERHAGPKSVVLVHDCLPVDEMSAARDRRGMFWTGDVWKLIPALIRWRPDLEIRTIAARPSGLGMITRLDPASRVLEQNYEAIVAEFMNMPTPLDIGQQDRLLARSGNDLAELEGYLRSRGYGA